MNPRKGKLGTTGIVPRVRTSWLQGAAAGNVTLTGIKLNKDFIVSVWYIPFPSASPWSAPVDLTNEFNITADNTINNTAGTSSLNGLLQVRWYSNDWGETTNVLRD